MSFDFSSISTKTEMKRSLSRSLYWYVEKCMGDFLEEYFTLVGKTNDEESLGNEEVVSEINQLITRMLELPLEFDHISRTLSVSIILSFVQQNINYTKGCKYLIATILRRKSAISGILKSDFSTLLEKVFFRDVKNEEYLKFDCPEKNLHSAEAAATGPQKQKDSCPMDEEDEVEVHPQLESRAYSEILIELYQKELVSATDVLGYLDLLSKKEPSYYHTDLLVFLLKKIGASVESRLNRGNYIRNGGSGTSTPTSSYSGTKATFEGIYKRLETLESYAISVESKNNLANITRARNKSKSRSKSKKTRSTEALTNVCMFRGSNPSFRASRFVPIQSASFEDAGIGNEEKTTAL